MGTRRRAVVTSTVVIAASRVSTALLVAASMALLARSLGESDFGVFSSVAAAGGLLGSFLAGGLHIDTARSAGLSHEPARILSRRLTLAMVGASLAISAAISVVSRDVALVVGIVGLLGAAAPAIEYAHGVALRDERNGLMLMASLAMPLGRVLAALAVVALAASGAGVDGYLALALLAGCTLGVGMVVGVTVWGRRTSEATGPDLTRALLSMYLVAVPGIVILAVQRLDLLMLGVFGRADEAGSYQLVLLVTDAPVVLLSAGLPVLLARGGQYGVERIVRPAMAIAASLGVAVAVTLLVVTPTLVRLIGGAEYSAAGIVVPLSISGGLALVRPTIIIILQVKRSDRSVAIDATRVLIAAVLLNIVMIPAYGAPGAAWATLLSNVIWVGASLRTLRLELHDAEMARR